MFGFFCSSILRTSAMEGLFEGSDSRHIWAILNTLSTSPRGQHPKLPSSTCTSFFSWTTIFTWSNIRIITLCKWNMYKENYLFHLKLDMASKKHRWMDSHCWLFNHLNKQGNFEIGKMQSFFSCGRCHQWFFRF